MSLNELVNISYYFQNKFKLKRVLGFEFDQMNRVC